MYKDLLKSILLSYNLTYADAHKYTRLSESGFSHAISKERISFIDMLLLSKAVGFSLDVFKNEERGIVEEKKVEYQITAPQKGTEMQLYLNDMKVLYENRIKDLQKIIEEMSGQIKFLQSQIEK